MRKAIVLMAISILAVMPLIGCTSTPAGENGPATPPPTLSELQQQINGLSSTLSTLNGRVSNLDSAIAGLGSQQAYDDTALQQQLSGLQSILTTLQTTLAAIDARVVALEPSTDGTNGTSVVETTRWDVDVWIDYVGLSQGLIDVDKSHKPIEDEDDYIIYLYLYNKNINSYETGSILPVDSTETEVEVTQGTLWLSGTKMFKCKDVIVDEEGTRFFSWIPADTSDIYNPIVVNEMNLSFRPESGDRVKVNADEVYLDSYGVPSLNWETEVSERSDGTCRKIKAVTNAKLTLPVPSGYNNRPECPNAYELRLEFELYYV